MNNNDQGSHAGGAGGHPRMSGHLQLPIAPSRFDLGICEACSVHRRLASIRLWLLGDESTSRTMIRFHSDHGRAKCPAAVQIGSPRKNVRIEPAPFTSINPRSTNENFPASERATASLT